MATKAQIDSVIKMMDSARPVDFFRCVDTTQAGINAVLQLLYESEEAVTAGKISEMLDISTARVAVLIKKMVAKGLITKTYGADDGRVVILTLTEYGSVTIIRRKKEMYDMVGVVIDKVGEKRLKEFITIAEEIKNAVSSPDFDMQK